MSLQSQIHSQIPDVSGFFKRPHDVHGQPDILICHLNATSNALNKNKATKRHTLLTS